MSDDRSRVYELATAILRERSRIRSEQYREPHGILHLSVADMQVMAEESQRQGDFFPRIDIKPGDEGTVYGLRCVADDAIGVGDFLLVEDGYPERIVKLTTVDGQPVAEWIEP